jgi:hypothetical protein
LSAILDRRKPPQHLVTGKSKTYVGLGRVTTASPRPRLASGESEYRRPSEVGLEVRRNCVSRIELALGETELRLPSEVGLGQEGTASPIRGWLIQHQIDITNDEFVQ